MRWQIVFVIILFLCVNSMAENASLTPEKKAKIEKWLKQLPNWPSGAGKKAAAYLVRQGKVSIPFLILALKEGKPRLQVASAYCLGKLKAKEALPYLAQIAENRHMISRLDILFTAMVKIDEEYTYPILLKFLKSSIHSGRYPAYSMLSGVTKPHHIPQLKALLKSPYAGTRQYAIQLISQIKNKTAIEILVQAMGDKSPQVASRAAKFLGQRDTDFVRKRLISLASDVDRRLRGYAILALIMQEDRFKKKLFSDIWVPTLLSAFRNSDPFIRGTAAVALVNVGFATKDQAIIDIMDRQLPPALIDTIAGNVYFRDYVSLRPFAYRKLKQLTGQDFSGNLSQWWKWWHRNRRAFKAIRLLRGIRLVEAKDMYLEYIRNGRDSKHYLLLANPNKDKLSKPGIHTVFMAWSQTVEILNFLNNIQIFQFKEVYGEADPNLVSHTIKLKIKNQIKKITVYGQNSGPLENLIREIERLVRLNRWQLYWDNYQYPDWEKWYRLNEGWFDRVLQKKLRWRRMKRMILSCYSWLRPEKRNQAAEEFLTLMQKDPYLSRGAVDSAMLHIRSESGFPLRNENLIRGLAYTKDTLTSIHLLKFLLRSYSKKAHKLMVFILDKHKKEFLLQYLKHPNPHLRSASLEVLGKHSPDDVTILYIMSCLKDKNAEVRQAAASTLGKLKVKIAWEQIAKMAKNKEEDIRVRQDSLEALSMISSKKSLSILLEVLGENDSRIRAAVARSMGKLGGRIAIQTLIGMLHDPSYKIRQIASDSLVKLKSRFVIKSLLRIAKAKGSIKVRISALKTLSRIRSRKAILRLTRLLEDREEEIRIHAALALANFYRKKAIPVLIAELRNLRHGFVIRKQLEKLTFQSYKGRTVSAIQSRYNDWYRLYKHLPRKQWFFKALRARGYKVVLFLDYLLDPRSRKVIPLLIAALNDKDWYIRASASYYLYRITRKSFGRIYYYTGNEETEKIRLAWQNWYEKK